MFARGFVRVPGRGIALAMCVLGLSAPPVAAQGAAASGPVEIGGTTYPSWSAYFQSDAFRDEGRRCGFRFDAGAGQARGSADCSSTNTNPSPGYEPDGVNEYVIQVVVHIIRNSAGTQGDISDQLVQTQIQVLNEDFQALKGTNGDQGHPASIRFELATTDPNGSPTTGITRDDSDLWFQDNGTYWTSIGWDPSRYMNIYTNTPSPTGTLGYVPFLPQSGAAGTASDRVVILWSVFGTGGFPYDLGRTVTHEVGHYLGLLHTFEGGCASGTPPGCYSSGDLICDTDSEQDPETACSTDLSCGTPDPVDNYMDYSWDSCMERFTVEQVRRVRCTLESYRADLYDTVPVPVRTTSWSSLKDMF